MATAKIVLLVAALLLLLQQAAAQYPDYRMTTPPRGWDSYDAFPVQDGPSDFNESVLLQQAAALATYNATGRFRTLVIDEGWAANNYAWLLDSYGRPTVNPLLYPSAADGQGFLPLSTRLKAEFGLELGLWIIKGIPKQAVELGLPILGTPYTARDIYIAGRTCSWHRDVYWVNMSHPAGQAYYNSLVQLYQSWGVSYIKIDCIFGADLDAAEVAGIAYAVAAYGQTAVGAMQLSLSPGNAAGLALNATGRLANMYRITGDLWDCWVQDLILCPSGTSIINQTYTLRDWQPLLASTQLGRTGYASFPDPDMLALGVIGLSGVRHMSYITAPGMARYVYGMWSITRSPIILGGDMLSVKALPWLDALLGNAALADMSMSSGPPTVAAFRDVPAGGGDGGFVVWVSPHGTITNAFYVGVFAFSTNASAAYAQNVTVAWAALNVEFASVTLMSVYDVFAQQPLPVAVAPAPGANVTIPVAANDAAVLLFVPEDF